VVVDGRWQIGDLDRRAGGGELPRLVVEADERILVGDIQLVADQCEPVRCVEVFREHRPRLVDTITVGVAQQGQTVAALHRARTARLDDAGDRVLRRQRRGATAAPFGNQDVAVRQDERLPRDLQVLSDGCDPIPLGNLRATITPECRLSDLHRGQQASVWLGQWRCRAIDSRVCTASACDRCWHKRCHSAARRETAARYRRAETREADEGAGGHSVGVKRRGSHADPMAMNMPVSKR